MELGIFLTRKVIAVYTAVAYRYNKKFVPKKQQVSPIFGILCQFSSVCMGISLVKPIFF